MDDTILIVDDVRSDLEQLERELIASGYQVETALSGQQALEMLHGRRSRVVIANWNMPAMDGLELCRAINQQKEFGFIYIIIMMESEHADRLSEAFDAGAADFIVKPVDTQKLVARLRTGRRMVELEKDLSQSTRKVLATNLEMEATNRRLAVANEQLSQLATTDELTGLPNRRTALARLSEHWSFSTRHGVSYSCIVVDIDHFKAVNDTHGHSVGDLVLKETARRLRSFARAEDTIFRFGGEEFLILCPHTSADGATGLADRHRRAIESNRIFHEGQGLMVTISAGVAERTEDMSGPDDLVNAADAALYAAKRAGRNLVYYDAEPLAVDGPDHKARQHEAPTVDADGGLPHASVMLLDNDPQSRSACRSLLAQEHYRVTESTDAIESLNRINLDPPDLIVLNETPDLDALDCARRLKANPATQIIPILLIGTRLDGASLDAALDAGADEYLTRPLTTHALLLRMRSLNQLSRSRQRLLRSNEIRTEQSRMLALALDYCRTLAATDDLDAILDQTVAVTGELTFSRRVSVMLPDPECRHLTIAKAIGIDADTARSTRVSIGSDIAGRVFGSRQSIVINSPEQGGKLGGGYDSRFYASVPMISNVSGSSEPVIGVLNVSNRHAGHPFEPRELEFIDLISNIAAAAIHQIQIRKTRDEAQNAAVVALAGLADEPDGGSGRPLDRVTSFCLILAEQLQSDGPYRDQIDRSFLNDLKRAAPLRDMSRVELPDDLLLKAGTLAKKELAIMRGHVEAGLLQGQAAVSEHCGS